MLDEDQINKRILEAAESYEPAYDDNAWNEMERLLDEHLPQKKDKRRIIFFLLLFLIPAAAIYFGIQYRNAVHTQFLQNITPANQATTPAGQPAAQAGNKSKNATPINKINRVPSANVQSHGAYATSLHNTKPDFSSKQSFNKEDDDNIAESMTTNMPGKRSFNNIENTSLTPPQENASSALPDISNDQTNDNIASNNEKAIKNNVAEKDSLNKNISNNKSNNKKSSGHYFAQNFAISISGGPDVSAVKLNRTGKVTMIKGVQISYNVSDKFTLRSGFLIAKKVYSANGSDYHSQYGNNYLQTVNADCNVYEVPLNLSYYFSKSKKHQWFVSTGLSSYFMKKESYEYFYKYPSGYTDTKYYSVSNKNKHYFSVFDLSAGYQYSINKKISLTAEPYVKLPVTGIGAGKIKLNSAGVLFSLNVKPF